VAVIETSKNPVFNVWRDTAHSSSQRKYTRTGQHRWFLRCCDQRMEVVACFFRTTAACRREEHAVIRRAWGGGRYSYCACCDTLQKELHYD